VNRSSAEIGSRLRAGLYRREKQEGEVDDKKIEISKKTSKGVLRDLTWTAGRNLESRLLKFRLVKECSKCTISATEALAVGKAATEEILCKFRTKRGGQSLHGSNVAIRKNNVPPYRKNRMARDWHAT